MLIIRDFQGIVPRINERALKDGIAEIAQDVNLAHHDLRPHACPVEFCTKDFDVKSIYSHKDCPCLAFDKITDIAKFVTEEDELLIKMDSGPVQIATPSEACRDEWCDIGVPCPDSPPLVSASLADGCSIQYTSYRYRFVNKYGMVGSPSIHTPLIKQNDNGSVTVSGFENPGGCITHIIIETSRHGFRSGDENNFEGGADWHSLATIPIGTSYNGTGSSFDIAPVLGMEKNFPPPHGLMGAVVLKSGALAGYIGKEIFISRSGQPNAFSGEYDLLADDDIVNLVEHGDDVYVITTGHHARLTMRLQDGDWVYDLTKIPEFLPCVSRESIASVGAGVLFSSKYGVAIVHGNSAKVVTDHVLYFDDWEQINAETSIGVGYAGQYYFYTNITGYIFQYGSGFYTDNKSPTFSTTTLLEPNALALSWDGDILAAEGGIIYKWEISNPITPCGTIPCCPYIYRTKLHFMRALSNFGSAKVVFDVETGPVNFKLYQVSCGKKHLIYERELHHCNSFRLPSGYLTTDYEVELSGCAVVKELHLDVEIAGLGDA